MIFDTDVLIWFFRGNQRAAEAIDESPARAISLVTFIELLQGAKSKNEAHQIKRFLNDFGFETLPLPEKVGCRASVCAEEYGLSHRTELVLLMRWWWLR